MCHRDTNSDLLNKTVSSQVANGTGTTQPTVTPCKDPLETRYFLKWFIDNLSEAMRLEATYTVFIRIEATATINFSPA